MRILTRSRRTICWKTLDISPLARLKTLSKGTKEKVQLILTMSRKAQLFLLDEPIGGVDPAARLHPQHHPVQLQRGRHRAALHPL